MITILSSIVNIIEGHIYDHLMSTRIFALIINKIFPSTPSITPSIPKWSSYLLEFFVPKQLFGLSTRLEIWGSKSNILAWNFHRQEVFWHRNFRGRFGVVDVFYLKIHTYNHSVNGQWALISPKLGARTIILGWRKYEASGYGPQFGSINHLVQIQDEMEMFHILHDIIK